MGLLGRLWIMRKRDGEIRCFDSHQSADAYSREQMLAMTPQERISLLLRMIKDRYGPFPRLERVLRVTELEKS